MANNMLCLLIPRIRGTNIQSPWTKQAFYSGFLAFHKVYRNFYLHDTTKYCVKYGYVYSFIYIGLESSQSQVSLENGDCLFIFVLPD